MIEHKSWWHTVHAREGPYIRNKEGGQKPSDVGEENKVTFALILYTSINVYKNVVLIDCAISEEAAVLLYPPGLVGSWRI